MKICIAGATGFIGKELCSSVAAKHEVLAITRRGVRSDAAPQDAGPAGSATGVCWRTANLFSLLETERAMEGADMAIYLVHSMLPPSRLTQGNFEDLDVILADNFARAARLKGVKRLIYLGGIIPDGKLSPHLRSRREVERVLAAHGVPLVSLRAGLVIGPNSSSFRIMEHLVGRLPVMICPKWTTTKCQPIALRDVASVISKAIDDAELPAGNYDIGGPDTLSYVDMMSRVAAQMRVNRYFLRVPFVSRTLSRLWVSTVTGTSRALVYPLIESLEHDLVARDRALQTRYRIQPLHFDEALRQAFVPADSPRRALPQPLISGLPRDLAQNLEDTAPMVTSVQRLPLPQGRSIRWIAAEYANWLPLFLRPLLRVEATTKSSLRFVLSPLGDRGPQWLLLELTYSPERSSNSRQLYYLTGGSLLRRAPGRARGRLEFRAVPGRAECIAAVLDFRPRLPWWLYKLTQAKAHVFIMYFFARHLRRDVAGGVSGRAKGGAKMECLNEVRSLRVGTSGAYDGGLRDG